ncbi:MAG: hypothetical protein HGB03_01090 [Candidatus Yonathbacteria bacterium]|nr:hypothetical protein [Candidatus Yonathbacteria bacterium]NTW47859.1 hypothetical protein [Candidatus Yonathbacteria bacterium]
MLKTIRKLIRLIVPRVFIPEKLVLNERLHQLALGPAELAGMSFFDLLLIKFD